jgi:hypothetical protein
MTQMKMIMFKSIIILVVFSFFQNKITAQVINWENISEQNKHLLHANAGAEYGVTAGLGYHYLIPVKKFPYGLGANSPYRQETSWQMILSLG